MKKITIISTAVAGVIAAVVAGTLLLSSSASTGLPIDAPGVVASNFKDGALSEAISTEDCTLTNGEEASCYRIIVTGTPVDTKIGPFCPVTTTTSAEDSGIWLDGSKVYDADGAFILDLSTIYGDAKWKLYDDTGKVAITDTKEAFQGAARPDVVEAYKYHCVEGKYEWTNTGKPVPISILVPVKPVAASSATTSTGADLGVTLNGLVIAASAPVDAILGAYTIAAFDDCGGHFNPIEGYHMHAYTNCEGANYGTGIDDPDAETRIIGYAMDGVAVFAPLAHDTTIKLDECNGRTTAADGYHYYAQSAEKNRTIKCYMGLTAVDESAQTVGGPPAGAGPPPGAGGALPLTQVIWIVAGSVVATIGILVATFLILRRRKNRKTASKIESIG